MILIIGSNDLLILSIATIFSRMGHRKKFLVGLYTESPINSILEEKNIQLWDARRLCFRAGDRSRGSEFEELARFCDTILIAGKEGLSEKDFQILQVLSNPFSWQVDWFIKRELLIKEELLLHDIDRLIVTDKHPSVPAIETLHVLKVALDAGISCHVCRIYSEADTLNMNTGDNHVSVLPDEVTHIGRLDISLHRFKNKANNRRKRLCVFTRPGTNGLLKTLWPSIDKTCETHPVDIRVKIHPGENMEEYSWVKQYPSVKTLSANECSVSNHLASADICITPYPRIGLEAYQCGIPTIFLRDDSKPPFEIDPEPGLFVCKDTSSLSSSIMQSLELLNHQKDRVESLTESFIDNYHSDMVKLIDG